MKKVSVLVTVEVPDDYKFNDEYELMEYINRWDLDYTAIWAKELEKEE